MKNNTRLLEYIRNGGTLIVMYQRIEEWKPEYAPYPFSISRNRITVETAPVTMLEPQNPIFNVPNKIDSTAWDDWVQERSCTCPRVLRRNMKNYCPRQTPANRRLIQDYSLRSMEQGNIFTRRTYGT